MEAERLTYLYQQSLTGTATDQDKKDRRKRAERTEQSEELMQEHNYPS